MRKAGTVFLVLISLCAFLHYPLSILYPVGVKDSVAMVFSYEFPHVFLASILSLVFIALNLQILSFKSKVIRLLAAAVALILLSSVIYSVPIYRALESMAFFTVPLAVFLAVRNETCKDIIYYIPGLLFILNLSYCLLFTNNVGIAGNQNWLAATLITSFPFFIICIRKFPVKVFYPLAVIFSALMVYILIKTSARALIPALGLAAFYFSIQRKSLKFNSLVFGSIAVLVLILAMMKIDKVQRVFNQDIRGPLAADTLSLIFSTPMLGTGPGNFQKDFPPYASDTVKKRIYYSSIVEHPHNELLNMMACCGIPVAVIWLIFIYFLLGRRGDFEGMALQLALVTGFVMGLADKPLTESPSAVVFLIICGLLIKDKYICQEESEVKGIKIGGPAIALVCLAFGIYRVQAETQSRYYFWKGENLRISMSSMNQRQIVPEMFKYYRKSLELDPYFIDAAYNAATISLHFYNSLSQDRDLLAKMIALEPDYSDFNKWIGLYHMKQARLLGEGEEKAETEAVAEEHYLRNYELSPWSINRCREVIRFYVETENDAKVEEWILKTGEIARDRLKARYTHTDRIDLQADLQLWVDKLKAGENLPHYVFDGMKASDAGDYSKFDIFRRTNNLRSYAFRKIEALDLSFYSRRINLIFEMRKRGINSTSDILDLMASFEVVDSGIKWPLDTLRDGKGSVRSLASLACTMNSLLGNSASMLINEKGLILCVLFEGGKTWIWNCEKGELFETSVEAFHNDPSLRKKIAGSEKDDFVYELFCYPEAFCLRNQLFSNLISMHPEIPEFALSPTLEKVRLRQRIGDRKIRYARKHIGLLDAAAMKR